MQNLTIDETVARLKACGYTVKKSGGIYRSQCPAHDGKDLNLAFTLGDNGRVMFTCHSHHCTYEEIMAALGIEKEENPVKRKPAKKTTHGKTIHPTLEKAARAVSGRSRERRFPKHRIQR